jgi:lipopolysaccharide assembly protein A
MNGKGFEHMQIIRTVIWVVITAILVSFIAINWTKVPVNFWPRLDGGYYYFTWPVGLVAILFFLLGMLPMWLLNKGTRWRLGRQISSLQDAANAAAAPSLSTTSLAEAAPENPAN